MLNLSEGWAIDQDPNQWIVVRQGPLAEGKTRKGSGWKPVAFVGSNKATLRRVLGELGAAYDAHALDALPDVFPATQPAPMRAAA